MRVMAQMAMVMNLDKCIGCHTCSVTCKQAWTNRSGVEYVWFNNVETRPGQGYPRTYQDQERWQGGWARTRRGRLKPRSGGRLREAAQPSSPTRSCRRSRTTTSPGPTTTSTCSPRPAGDDTPVARPKSLLTGKDTKITWSANWDDSLGRRQRASPTGDPILLKARPTRSAGVREGVHVLPAAHLRALPQPVLRRVLPVRRDLQAGRGRHRAGRPGPLPRLADVRHRLPVQEDLLQPPHRQGGEVHVLLPAHRGRHAHRLLGDLRRPAALHRPDALRRRPRVGRPRPSTDEHDLYEAQRSVFLDPHDPAVVAAAARGRHPRRLDQRRAALPDLGPDHRSTRWRCRCTRSTARMPMVWYIPPLSPVVDILRDTGHDGEDARQPVRRRRRAAHPGRVPGRAVHRRRPGAGRPPCCAGWPRCARTSAASTSASERDESIAAAVGMTGEQMDDMYRLLAIAKYEDRYVIPAAHAEEAHQPRGARHRVQPRLRGRAGHGRLGTVRRGLRRRRRRSRWRTSTCSATGRPPTRRPRPPTRARVNLLNWDGKGAPGGLFPPTPEGQPGPTAGTDPAAETEPKP